MSENTWFEDEVLGVGIGIATNSAVPSTVVEVVGWALLEGWVVVVGWNVVVGCVVLWVAYSTGVKSVAIH